MKKMNNKGFSLVELIIVIAIMAILIAVLAPQYLRYVEKSRLQADNSMIGEVSNAVKVALANEDVALNMGASDSWTPTQTATAATFTCTQLNGELQKVVGDQLKIGSNTYKATAPVIVVTKNASDGTFKVTCQNYKADVNGTVTTVDM